MATRNLIAEADRLRAEINRHNGAIRQHRKSRRQAIEALAALERQCAAHGVRLILVPQHSRKGAVHGHPEDVLPRQPDQ